MTLKIGLSITDSFMMAVLDFAPTVLVAQISNGTITQQNTVPLTEGLASLRAGRLKDLGITTILCGAVSDSLSMLTWYNGIEIIPGLGGNAETVLSAYISNNLTCCQHSDFHPGFRRGRRFRNRGTYNGGRHRP